MESNNEFGNITFDLPKNQSNVIKVIGVGGGGSNAINHMFRQGIAGVDFVVCNTDSQALQTSPVPNKIQLGVNLTEGLGAGAKPEVGQQAALESIEEIEKMLDANTKMVFITAGMGGGTGTGAAPVILLSFNNGESNADWIAILALSTPEATKDPIIAVPLSLKTVFASLRSIFMVK